MHPWELCRYGRVFRLAACVTCLAAGFFLFTFHAIAQPRPDLQLSGSISTAPVSVGELTTFLLNVTNAGNAAATQVTLTSVLSSNATIFTVTSSQGSFVQSNGNVTCSVGSLTVGAGATIQITASSLTNGTFTNSASVTELELDQNSANNVLTQTVLCVPLTFYSGPNLNVGRAYHTATKLLDGKVLITGGNTSTGWTATAEMVRSAGKDVHVDRQYAARPSPARRHAVE